MNIQDRHGALKVLSAYASRETEAGRLRERDILREVTGASPLHHGFKRVVHLLHEFTFESFVGQYICFAVDVLSYSVPSSQSQLSDPRLPLKWIIHLKKQVLVCLEYLYDECKVSHSGMLCTPFTVATGRSHHPTGSKPGNILLLPSDIDKIVVRELSDQPATIYDFPRTVPPNELPFHPVLSIPRIFSLGTDQHAGFYWVIADLGHGALTRCAKSE